MGNVDEKFITEASEKEVLDEGKLDKDKLDSVTEVFAAGAKSKSSGKSGKFRWVKWAGSIAAVLAVVVGVATSGGMNNKKEAAMAFSTTSTTSGADTYDNVMEESKEDVAETESSLLEAPLVTLGMTNEETILLVDDATPEDNLMSERETASASAETKTEANPTDSGAAAIISHIPEMPDLSSKNTAPDLAYDSDSDTFAEDAALAFLTGNDENKVYSPSNIYMALAMLAEITDGKTRNQILAALDAEDMTELRDEAEQLWYSSNTDDGQSLVLTGNSLWGSNDFAFNQQTLENLADKYHAYSFTGTMGSDIMNQTYKEWLSERTKGLLDSCVGDAKLDPGSILNLVSTLYYKSAWTSAFDPSSNETADFNGSRKTTSTTFMTDTSTGVYYQDSNKTFTAVSKDLYEGTMWFILPEEGYSTDKVLASDDLYELMTEPYDNDCISNFARIHMAIPKFDISCRLNLIDGLKKLGITDVFTPMKADFSPLTTTEGCYVATAEHAARLLIDEDGVEAAAYTNIDVSITSIVVEQYEFRADRPFLFALTNNDGVILFQGVVNNID